MRNPWYKLSGKWKALFLLWLGTVPFLYGQSASQFWQQGIAAYGRSDVDSCGQYLSQAANLYANAQQWDSVAWCYRYSLALYNYKGRFEEVIAQGTQVVQRLPQADYGMVRILMMVGYAYEQQENLLEAYNAYQKAYLICVRHAYYDAGLGSYLWRPLANIATRLGEYDKAKRLLKQWLYELSREPNTTRLQQEASNDLCLIWHSLEEPDSVLAVASKALAMNSDNLTVQGLLQMRVASAYQTLGQLGAGQTAVKLGIQALSATPLDNIPSWQKAAYTRYLSNGYHISGQLWEAMGELEKAQAAYTQALQVRSELPINFQPRGRAKVLSAIGNLALKQNSYGQAHRYFREALSTLTKKPASIAIDSTDIYPENSFYEVFAGLCTLYEVQEQPDSARWAIRWALVAGQLLWQNLKVASAKLALGNNLHEMYGTAVRLGMQQDHPLGWAEALFWQEQHRAAYLQESLNLSALEEAIYPDSLLRYQRRLRASIQLPQIASAQRFAWEQAYDTLQTYLQTRYPLPSKGSRMMNLKELQAQVREHRVKDALLYYAWYEPTLYGWLITADTVIGHTWQAPELPHEVAALQEQLTSFDLATEQPKVAQQAFQEQSFGLYSAYVNPLLRWAPDAKRIILLPDGPLQDIPFEVLLTQDELQDWSSAPYLLRKHSLAYLPALRWLTQEAPEEHPSGEFVALAATYPEPHVPQLTEQLALRSGEVPLPYAKEEVEQLSQYWPTHAILGAAEADFKGLAPQASVLHLAMHAITHLQEPQRSGLQFTPQATESYSDFLYQSELLAVPLRAQLVTLSACNTGLGQRLPGEGPLSLARSFLQAGAGGVTMSLWKVPDRETAQLMDRYYAALADKLSPDAALQQAKLNYLSNTTTPLQAHPFYWAGFVHTGESTPLRVSPKQEIRVWIWGGLAVLTLFIAAYLWRRCRAIGSAKSPT